MWTLSVFLFPVQQGQLSTNFISFTHMWKALAWPHHFTKRGRLGLIKLVYPLHFLLKYVCQGVLNLRQFLGFSIRYWNCVVLFVFVFHFIFYQKKEMIKCTFEFERLDRLSVLSVLWYILLKERNDKMLLNLLMDNK